MRNIFIIYWRQIFITILYVSVVLLIGCLGLDSLKLNIYYIAARNLQLNHRLTANDLAPPSSGPGSLGWGLSTKSKFIGKYISVEEIKKGDPVGLDKLSADISLGENEGSTWTILPINKQITPLALLDAGKFVRVYQVSPPQLLSLARVHGIFCDDSDVTTNTQANSCFVMLETSCSDQKSISVAKGPLTLSLVP